MNRRHMWKPSWVNNDLISDDDKQDVPTTATPPINSKSDVRWLIPKTRQHDRKKIHKKKEVMTTSKVIMTTEKGRQKVSLSHINRERRLFERDFWEEEEKRVEELQLLNSGPLKTRQKISKNSSLRDLFPKKQTLRFSCAYSIESLTQPFIYHPLSHNEHNGGRRHFTLSRTTLKIILLIYCYLQITDVNNLTS